MARQPGVPQAVRQFLETLDPSPSGMVVAVSGGADSVALLRALHEIGIERLIVAHFNHGLRGQESDDDASFVADLGRKLNLPFAAGRFVPNSKSNSEVAMRAQRYTWLASAARTDEIDTIAIGHNADDQAETILFRLLRGSGLLGLSGIARRMRLSPELQVIRPLLRVSREAIVEYLRGINQPWRDDSSNRDRRYTRNRIRHELLPHLKCEYNPRVSEALVRLGEQSSLWRRLDANGVALCLATLERPRAGPAVVFDRPAAESLPRSALQRIWYAVWRREGWPRADMGAREYERIAKWCRTSSAALELPGGIRMKRLEHTIVAGPTTKE